MANPNRAWCSWSVSDPEELAEAARVNVDLGAQIIDINMGCPAKKVCNRDCGSALLADEALVAAHPRARWCAQSQVPVTLKIRTGTDPTRRNAPRIAAHRPARAASRRSSIHGRTRADMFRGEAEHDTTATRARRRHCR